MQKKYKKIEIELGSTIEEAVNKLHDHKKKGQLVYCEFNGTNLYSDVDTLDSAYQEIMGMSKVEFTERIS